MIASLLRRLTKVFAPKVDVSRLTLTRPVKIWDITEHQGWGNRIGWFDFDRLKLSGHTTPWPEEGDILHCPLKSGEIGKFRFVKIEWAGRDVWDMWFADMEKI